MAKRWGAGLIILWVVVLSIGYRKFQAWRLECAMQFYEVRENFPDPAAQHLISLIFQGDIKGALAAAKDVPGGVNVTGTRGGAPLDAAVWRVNLPMVKALLKAGANPDGDARQVPLEANSFRVRLLDLESKRWTLQ